MQRSQEVQHYMTLVTSAQTRSMVKVHEKIYEALPAAIVSIQQLQKVSRVKKEQHLRALEIVNNWTPDVEVKSLVKDVNEAGLLVNLILDLENNYVDPSQAAQTSVLKPTMFDADPLDPEQAAQKLNIPDAWAGFSAKSSNPLVAPPGSTVSQPSLPPPIANYGTVMAVERKENEEIVVPWNNQTLSLYQLQILLNDSDAPVEERILASSKQHALSKSTKLAAYENEEVLGFQIRNLGEVTA